MSGITTERTQRLRTLEDEIRTAKTGQIEAIADNLSEISAEGWEQLERSHPGLVKSLNAACDRLKAALSADPTGTTHEP